MEKGAKFRRKKKIVLKNDRMKKQRPKMVFKMEKVKNKSGLKFKSQD